MTERWFVDNTWAPVDWATAVTGGRAQIDIFTVLLPEGGRWPWRVLWAPNGSPVSAEQVAYAQSIASADPVPTRRPVPEPLPGTGESDPVASQTLADHIANHPSGGGGAAEPSGIFVRRVTAYANPANTHVRVPWDTVDREDGEYGDPLTNGGNLIAPADGWYVISAHVRLAAQSTCYLRLAYGATTDTAGVGGYPVVSQIASEVLDHAVAGVAYLTAGQAVWANLWTGTTVSHARMSMAPLAGVGAGGGGGPQTFVFSGTGPVAVGTGARRFYNDTGQALTISTVRASVVGPVTGGPDVVDVHLNGTTIFTDQATRPSIPAGQATATATPQVTTWPAGGYLTVDVDAVAPTPGSDLVVTVVAA